MKMREKRHGSRLKQKMAVLAVSMAVVAGGISEGQAAANPDGEDREFLFDPLVVTALRTEKKDFDTPATVNVYTQEDLRATGAVNLFDALRLQTGIQSYSYGPGGQAYGGMHAKILIRGWDRGTLVMIDGVRINLNDFYALDTLPIEAIERVEIVKGSSSVLYGNDASGGVINIITKKAGSNSISFTVGEYGQHKQSISLNTDRFQLAGTLQKSDVLKGLSSNGNAFGDSEKSSILWKYQINDRLTLMHQHTENDYFYQKFSTVAGSINWNTPTSQSNYDYKEDFLRLKYEGESWNTQVYANQSKRNTLPYTATTLNPDPAKKSIAKYRDIGLETQINWNSGSTDFIGGIAASFQTFDSDDRKNNEIIDVERDSYSLFLQGTKELGGNVTAIVGARQEWVQSTNKKDLDAFCPQFQLLKKMNEQNSVYMNIGKSFKMPTFTSLYGNASEVFKPNPNLTPEEGWSYEVGWKHLQDDSMLKAALYTLDMDTITYDNTSGLNIPVNNPYRNTGVEISYDKQINERFSYAVGANYGDPKVKDKSGVWARRFARQQYTGSLKYHYEQWQAALSGSITADRAGGWQDMIPVNLNVRYAATPKSSIDLTVENLFDRRDIIGNWSSSTSTEYYALPRNVRMTYTQMF